MNDQLTGNDPALQHGSCKDSTDKILWCGTNNGRIPEAEYRIRVPPKNAVEPCIVKCLHCKIPIDIFYVVLEDCPEDNAIYDIDCPHCWQCNAFTTPTTIQKLVRFRKKCAKFIDPPVSKAGRVSTALRFKILERDYFKCAYCGANPQITSLHIDHKLPVSEGGTNELSNLITACAECNLGKGARSVDIYD